MANDYDINYDDERFQDVEDDREAAMDELNETYDGMIDESEDYYQSQIDASKKWAEEQARLQQEKTDFEIQKIEQQKAQEHKDYLKEQSGAYVDWQKQSNQYGAEAENMAASGLSKTGFSESSQVSMYNTYQSRVASARESYKLAVLNYDNAMTEARLQNSSILAEIAYNALQQQLELSLQGFQYKNQLLLEKANRKTELDQMYYNRYQDVLAQINHENSMAEQIRQFNLQYSRSSGGGGGSSKKNAVSSVAKAVTDKVTKGVKSVGNKLSGSAINSASVIGLGKGPYNDNTIAKKVASGELTATEKNGQIYVEKNPSYIKGQDKLRTYTKWVK
jgi:hypothetical protein